MINVYVSIIVDQFAYLLMIVSVESYTTKLSVLYHWVLFASPWCNNILTLLEYLSDRKYYWMCPIEETFCCWKIVKLFQYFDKIFFRDLVLFGGEVPYSASCFNALERSSVLSNLRIKEGFCKVLFGHIFHLKFKDQVLKWLPLTFLFYST